jgi:hypothetical protein
MTIEMIALTGSVFAGAALAALAYERHMDVLYGPYIEGRTAPTGNSVQRIWTPIRATAGLFHREPGGIRCRRGAKIAC